MNETLEDRKRNLFQYIARFQQACKSRGAPLPSQTTMTAYYDDAIDCDLAIGHYIVERLRTKLAESA